MKQQSLKPSGTQIARSCYDLDYGEFIQSACCNAKSPARLRFAGLCWLGALILSLVSLSLEAGSFVTNSPLQLARAYHTTTLLQNGKLLVAGGYNGSPIAVTEIYDPTTGTTATNGALSAARYQHTATLLPNGKVLVAGGLVAGNVPTNSAELYDPVSGSWTLTEPMNTARFYHTATLLSNGLVLVAGGEVGYGVVTNSAELYNPATGTWTLTGPMVQGRYADTATLLEDGTVLATGGLVPGITPTAELYDPVAGTWSLTGSLNFDRSGHVATRLPNGEVLAAGGVFLGEIYSAEVYIPATKSWAVTGSLNALHVYDTATLLPNGKVLAVSGYYNSSADLTTNATEMYDPTTTNWTFGPPVNNGRAYHTATLLPDGEVVLVGGYNGTTYLASIETFEATNGSWTATNPMSSARSLPTLTLLTNGQALAAGGYNLSLPTNTEAYNPATGNWTLTTGAMNQARYLHAATLLPDGQVLVTGGLGSTGLLPSAELFNPVTGLWALTNSMHSARAFHTATLLPSGRVLVAAGENTNAIATAEIYDPAAGTWTVTGSLNGPRFQHTATLLPNGTVLVTGGYDTNDLASVETYNPSTGLWTTNNPMNFARQGHTATLLPNGKVLVAGGTYVQNRHDFYPTTAELFDPATGMWTLTGSLNFGRENHTATLLPNGQVLVAGGDAAGASVGSSELFNPATGLWSLSGTLSTARSEAAATLLPNGQVLVVGGEAVGGSGASLTNAELFNLGQGFNSAWQPQVSALNSPLTLGGVLVVTGAQFRGISEASGGNASQDSPADYPLLQLHALANDQSRYLAVTNWTTNSLTTVAVTNFPPGWALATIFANGIPSQSTFLEVQKATATVSLSNLVQFFDLAARPVSVTTVPPGLAVNVSYNGSFAAPTNVGSYTVTAIVNDPNYSGAATNTLQIELLRNYGVDASHFQDSNGIPEANWAQMFGAGQRFAFVKATEGLTGPDDPTMATNVADATAAGLLVGVYHFAHPENRPTTNGAVQEADHFLSYAGSAIGPGTVRPVLDIETGNGTLTPSQMSDWVLAFSQEVVNQRGADAVPIIYCTQPYANSNFDSRVAGQALWLQAAGGGDPTFNNPPTNGFSSATGIFTNWVLWQYNISGSAGGISPIDLDVCHDDLEPLASLLIPLQVMNTNDSGPGSLRQIISQAVDGETITFAPGLAGTIFLTNGPIVISNSLAIIGPGPKLIFLASPNSTTLLEFSGGKSFLSGLTITQGGNPAIGNSANLTVSNCEMVANYGPAIQHSSNNLTVLNSSFRQNNGSGLIMASNALAWITNCTFYENYGLDGPAIFNQGALTLVNCTVAFNESGSSLAGSAAVYNTGLASIANSVIAGNYGFPGGVYTPEDVAGNFASQGFNFIGATNGSAGFTNGVNHDQTGTAAAPINPLFGNLAYNGGQTMNLMPTIGSPLIDQGNCFGAATDQRGFVRTIEFPQIADPSGGDGTDVGAVEFGSSLPCSDCATQVTIDASQTLRPADARWFGANTAAWETALDTTDGLSLLNKMGVETLRYPGGSLCDTYFWSSNYWVGGTPHVGPTAFTKFIQIATNLPGVNVFISVNYGSSTSNDAAAWVRSANITNNCGFKYWEVGNEVYFSTEPDENTNPPYMAHDAWTYATRFCGYYAAMKAVDPTIKVGAVVTPGEDVFNAPSQNVLNPRTGLYHSGWTPVLLATLNANGILPDFLIHHFYPENGTENDPELLQEPVNWEFDAGELRQEISDYIGPAGTNIELLCTENNSDADSNLGKQSTSLVNGLYLADSLGRLMQTEFNSYLWWIFESHKSTSGDFSPSLYGWRTYGDFGLALNITTEYPTFYAMELMHDFVQPGDIILNTGAGYPFLDVMAATKTNGTLSVLFINKDRTNTFSRQIVLNNFSPSAAVTIRSYGMPQDDATETNGPLAMQDIATNQMTVARGGFYYAFPPYSMTLFTLVPTGPQLNAFASSNHTLVVSWPWPSSGWNLVQNTNLAIPNWTTPPETVQNDGTNNFIIISPPIGSRFFELTQP